MVGADSRWRGRGDTLENALCDEADLDVTVIGRELSSDGVAVSICFSVQVLVSRAVLDKDSFYPDAGHLSSQWQAGASWWL